MNLVDTHCHLHFEDFDADREEAVRRAREAGVEYFVNVGTDPETNDQARALAARYPNMVWTAGLHPHSAHQADDRTFELLEKQVAAFRPAAIGEIGLDYFKSEGDPETQKKVFRRMVALAKKNGLPVIVHSRDAFEDTYEILRQGSPLQGVMHCFSYDGASMKKLLDLGLFISFACNITYKNAGILLETAKQVPLDRVVFETDSPYLSPQSKRGRRNEPLNLVESVAFLAERRGMDPDALAEESSANAQRLFGLGS